MNFFLTIVSALLMSWSAAADDQVTLASWQTFLDDPQGTEFNYAKEMCGYHIPALLDKSIVAGFVKAGNDASYYCQELRTKLATMCRNSESLGNNNKAKITAMIKKIECKGGVGEEIKFIITPDGTLIATLGPKSSNLSESLLAFMDKTPMKVAAPAAKSKK